MSLFDSQAVSFHNKLEVFQVDPRVVVVTSTHKIVGDGQHALRAPLMDVFKGVLRGGLHQERGRYGAKTAKLNINACTIMRTPLT
ncbi:unnamed protein product, partial [Brassica rapa subsp. narinosa]